MSDTNKPVLNYSDIINNQVIFINTKDIAQNGVFLIDEDNRSKFGLYLKKEIRRREDELFKVIVQSVEIPYTWNNTNSTNNYIDWSENAVLQTPIQITAGNYNILELAKEIKNQLNTNTSNGITYNLVYNGKTNKITISSDSVLDTIFLFNSGSNVSSSISSFIGFTNDNDITINSSSNALSDSICNLIYTSSLFIRSNLSSLNTIDSKKITNSNILINIPVQVNPLQTIQYQYYEGVEVSYNDDDSIDYIEISLTDINGNNINLGKKIDWSIVLGIQTIKDPEYTKSLEPNFNDKVEDIPDRNINTLQNEYVNLDDIISGSKEILKRTDTIKQQTEHIEHKNIIDDIQQNLKK